MATLLLNADGPGQVSSLIGTPIQTDRIWDYLYPLMFQRKGLVNYSNCWISRSQDMATKEKLVLEDNQRAVHKELKEKAEDWKPKYFEQDSMSENPHAWIYKYSEYVSVLFV